MKVGVLVFPGTWSHQDFAHVLQDVLGVPNGATSGTRTRRWRGTTA